MNPLSTPTKTLLRLWWAITWRFVCAFGILLLVGFGVSMILQTSFGLSDDAAIFLILTILIIGSLLTLYLILRDIISKPLGDTMILAIDKSLYTAFLPPGTTHIHGRLTKQSEPYQLTMTYDDGTTYKAIQLNPATSAFRILDANDNEVARSTAFPPDNPNRHTITRTNADEPSITAIFTGTLNQFTLHVKNTTEPIHYRRPHQQINALGNATVHFRLNQFDAWYNPDAAPLSQPLFAATVFFIYLQRAQATI